MKKFITINILLLAAVVLSAQTNMQFQVKLKNGAVFTDNNNHTFDIDAAQVESVTFAAKPIPGNPQHVKLLDTSNIEWATINFGANKQEEIGEQLKWSAEDVVYNNWTLPDTDNRKWRTPTVEEIVELIYQCDWTPTDDGKGYWVTNKNNRDKKIYLPSTTNYWSSTPDGDNKAEAIFFSNGPQQVSTNQLGKLAIRPVWDVTK